MYVINICIKNMYYYYYGLITNIDLQDNIFCNKYFDIFQNSCILIICDLVPYDFDPPLFFREIYRIEPEK